MLLHVPRREKRVAINMTYETFQINICPYKFSTTAKCHVQGLALLLGANTKWHIITLKFHPPVDNCPGLVALATTPLSPPSLFCASLNKIHRSLKAQKQVIILIISGTAERIL